MGRRCIRCKGYRLGSKNDEVVGMIWPAKDQQREVLVVSENGYAKRSDIDGYRVTNRGGKGVKNH